MSVAVLYLDRFGNRPGCARAFLSSLFDMPAGAGFDLVWISKNYPDGAINPEFAAVRPHIPVDVEHRRYPDDIYQFAIMRDVAHTSRHEMLIFFTSWSRVLAPLWLRRYLDAFAAIPCCGIAGATGSYEAMTEAPDFPNAHVRSNAFMIRREVFLDLDLGSTESLYDGRLIEAGPNSMTRQVETQGLAAIVLGRDGRRFARDEWPRSRTFRSGRQENLLVADNRTVDYARADRETRIWLAKLAWRDQAVIEPPGLFERAAWHLPRVPRAPRRWRRPSAV